ncbi:MAG: hypothetical protein N2645_12805 [Clostridia bacterium]|nr:hypothetical protein [Clostridia bacterium]
MLVTIHIVYSMKTSPHKLSLFQSRSLKKSYLFMTVQRRFHDSAIPLSSSPIVFTSVLRYYLVSFPVFIFMGVLSSKNKIAEYIFTVLLFGFNVLYIIGFINNYFFVV